MAAFLSKQEAALTLDGLLHSHRLWRGHILCPKQLIRGESAQATVQAIVNRYIFKTTFPKKSSPHKNVNAILPISQYFQSGSKSRCWLLVFHHIAQWSQEHMPIGWLQWELEIRPNTAITFLIDLQGSYTEVPAFHNWTDPVGPFQFHLTTKWSGDQMYATGFIQDDMVSPIIDHRKAGLANS